MTSPPKGMPPSDMPVKLHNTLSVQPEPLGVNSNTVPNPFWPPPSLVPYRLPCASLITGAEGSPPSSAPVKGYSTLSVQVPPAAGLNSNTVPWLLEPPANVVPTRL